MSQNPFSDRPTNPYAPPEGDAARGTNGDAAERLAARLKVQPVAIVLMTLAALNLPVMVYLFCFHIFFLGQDRTFLMQMLAWDSAMTLTTLLTLYGANEFRRLGNRSAARTAAILACIPFCTPCIVVGIPFGIWGLMVLSQSDVRAAFES
jgi:hypothetical protein